MRTGEEAVLIFIGVFFFLVFCAIAVAIFRSRSQFSSASICNSVMPITQNVTEMEILQSQPSEGNVGSVTGRRVRRSKYHD